MGPQHAPEVGAVPGVDDVPVVKICELHGVPLDVFARLPAVAADVVGIDGSLVPVDVQEGVAQRRGAGCGERLADPSRGHTALALDDMDPRTAGTERIAGAEGQPEGGGHSDTRGPGRQADERGCRSRVPVQRLDVEFPEQRRPGGGVAPEAEQVLETQLLAFVLGQKFRRGDPRNLVA